MDDNSESGPSGQGDRYFEYAVRRHQHDGITSFIDAPQSTYGSKYPSWNQALPDPINPQFEFGSVASSSQPSQSAPQPHTATQAPRATRSKYGSLAWDRHKETLRRLYLDENKSLPEIMRIMNEKHSFDAS